MRISDSNENQVSFFDLFEQQFPIPDAISKPKVITRSKRVRVKKLEEQMEFFLDILEAPDAIMDVPEEWTKQDISDLRVFMLFRHLKLILDSRCSSKHVVEAWEWIMDDDITPFSFRTCVQELARSIGLADEKLTCVDPQEVRLVFFSMAERAGCKPAFSLKP
jgi:hypothetical protein